MSLFRVLVLAVCGAGAAAVALPAVANGQGRADTGVQDPNGHPFRMPTISPIEPIYRLAPVYADTDGDDEWVGIAEFGDYWAFWLRRRPEGGLELAAAFHGHAASRFSLEAVHNTFIDVTFRAGGYLRARLGSVAARLDLFHVSSHLGDEYVVDNDVEPLRTAREGIELLFEVSPYEGAILFGGPGFILRSSLPLESMSWRVGSEWESVSGSWARPYAGADLFVWGEQDWRPQLTAEAGAALGRNARLGILLALGPPRADQFLYESETLIGLSFSYRRR
ncbi:MAG: DUF1207 domain-containing protein [Gemmatimonadota bacterium]|nr:DUF1207 domain-containing protein [Gemmatimonadota bacterium]